MQRIQYLNWFDTLYDSSLNFFFFFSPNSSCSVYFFPVTDRCERNYCYHGSNDYCFAISLSLQCHIHVKRVELLYVKDIENPVSGLWLEVFLCVSYTTMASHADTAPISTIYFESMWALFYAMETTAHKTLFVCKRMIPRWDVSMGGQLQNISPGAAMHSASCARTSQERKELGPSVGDSVLTVSHAVLFD